MNIVVFGLTISSSWGNGHATLWRGLCAALNRQGHRVVFFERDTEYYAGSRDLFDLPGGELVIYDNWENVGSKAKAELAAADTAIVTSYCPDAIAASELMLSECRGVNVFYDLDTPVTVARLRSGDQIPYIGPRALADFDLVLSYTGGAALDILQHDLGARRVAPLYGHVDPQVHRPVDLKEHYRSDLSYLGTYSADRQRALMTLMIEPACQSPERRFLIAGAQYPQDFPWCPNLFFVRHLPPSEHPAFFSSSRLTLNVTRRPMAELGWCPSGRLFEAAACGTATVSDLWEGLDSFFTPGQEIFAAADTNAVLAALELSDAEIRRVAEAARERTLAEHTSEHRSRELIAVLESVHGRSPELAGA
jgi:spore maturation protein CgeB